MPAPYDRPPSGSAEVISLSGNLQLGTSTPRKEAETYRPPDHTFLTRVNGRAPNARPKSGASSSSRACGYYGRRAASAPGRGNAHSNAPGLKESQPYAGSVYQFYLSPSMVKQDAEQAKTREMTQWKHFDVVCKWDKGETVTDTYELSDSMRHSRLTYSHSLFKEHADISNIENKWQAFLKALQVDVDDLATWTSSLSPRSIHDYKPMMVLQQQIIQALMNKEISFFSGTILDLQQQLKQAMAIIMKQTAEMDELRKILSDLEGEVTDKTKKARMLSMFGNVKSGMVVTRNDEIDKLRQAMQKDNEDADAALQMRLAEERRLKDLVAKLDLENEQLQEELRKANAKIEELENALDGKNRILSIEQDDKKKKMNIISKLKLHVGDRDLSLMQHQQRANVGYMPWVSTVNGQLFVESKWATFLSVGLCTLAVPPLSRVELSAKVVMNGQFVDVPGGTAIALPPGDTQEATISSNCVITFPDDMEKAEVLVHGGTQIILPSTGRDEYDIVLPPGTHITPPQDEARLRAAEELKEDVKVVPPGGTATVTMVKGSSIRLPLGMRAKIEAPTGCQYFFSSGQKQRVTVPGRTNITSPTTVKDFPAMLPSKSVLTLPVQDISNMSYLKSEASETYTLDRTFHVILPCSSMVYLPKTGEDMTVTIPHGAAATSPQDRGTADIGEGKTVTVDNGVPRTLTCAPGTTVSLPWGHSARAEDVAKQMQLAGPACTATALGGMEPALVVNAFSSGVLELDFRQEILSQSRPEVVQQVIKRMPAVQVNELMDTMDRSVTGAWMSIMPVKDQALMFAGKENAPVALEIMNCAQQISLLKNMLPKCNDQLSKATQECAVNMVELNSTAVGALVLAGSQSSHASTVMNAMSTIDLEVACQHLEALLGLAGNMITLSRKYKSEDMAAARLLQALELADTDTEVREEVMSVLVHFEKAYGIQCTVMRNDPDNETSFSTKFRADAPLAPGSSPVPTNPASPGASGGATNPQEPPSTPPPGEEETGSTTPLGRMSRVEGITPTHEFIDDSMDNSEFAVEQEAQDRVDILYSTEDIKWGAMSSARNTSASRTGFVTQMDARRLLHIQEEAKVKKQMVMRGAMLMIPVITPAGKTFAFISHVIPSLACKHFFGGLRPPTTFSIPKTIECLMLLSKALLCGMEKAAMTAANQATAPMPDNEHDKGREELMRLLTNLNKMKADLYKNMLKNREKIQSHLHEIKNYSKPPEVMVRVMTTLYVLMKNNDVKARPMPHHILGCAQDFVPYLGQELYNFPKDEKDLMKLWKFVRGNIQLSQRHPNNILRMLYQATKERALGDSGNQLKKAQIKAVEKLMDTVDDEKIAKASSVGSMISEFIKLGIKQAQVELKLMAMEADDIQHKRRVRAKEEWNKLSSALFGAGNLSKLKKRLAGKKITASAK
ncbi:hypothetical protein CYMTET_29256 [Cymbomonas tetramitiformis]|uniref:Uncharacterized protein n=1 Tax=Cymbomonas tetramitiformis TaxID=36881 RepID=A0AAE0KV37_9CHLO|nr:hypothetical protein CYMTET_29256 [Cymbomonas tetramitiformis]